MYQGDIKVGDKVRVKQAIGGHEFQLDSIVTVKKVIKNGSCICVGKEGEEWGLLDEEFDKV